MYFSNNMSPSHKQTSNYLSGIQLKKQKSDLLPSYSREMAMLYSLKEVMSMGELRNFLKNIFN